jgi:thiamine biosynthesis lipoprotein
LSTSGIYRKFHTKKGKRYSHEIDPKRGKPVENNIISVSVLANDCSMADGLSTAFMVMGIDKIKDFVGNRRHNVDVYVIMLGARGDTVRWYSSGLEKLIVE